MGCAEPVVGVPSSPRHGAGQPVVETAEDVVGQGLWPGWGADGHLAAAVGLETSGDAFLGTFSFPPRCRHHPLSDSFGVSSCRSLRSLWQPTMPAGSDRCRRDLTGAFVSLDGKRSTRCVSSFRTG